MNSAGVYSSLTAIGFASILHSSQRFAPSLLQPSVPRSISLPRWLHGRKDAQPSELYCAQFSELEVGPFMPSNVVEAPAATSNADFQSLEEKILRTIEVLKVARAAKKTAERAPERLREQLSEREEELDSVRAELVALRREREEVRTRVEKMLDQIETLTAEE